MRFGKALIALACMSLSVNAQQAFELTPEEKAMYEAQKRQIDAKQKQNTFATGAVPLNTEEYKLSETDRDLMLRAQKRLLDITNGEIPQVAKGLENITETTSEQANKYNQEAQNIEKRTQFGISQDQYKALEIIAGDDSQDLIQQMKQAEQQIMEEQVVEDGEKVKYFISYSMPARIVDEILISAAKNKNAEVLIRGLMDGMDNVGQMIRFVDSINLRLHKQGKIEKYPNVQLAPIEFMKYDIARAPSMVLTENGEVIKAQGLTTIEDLKRRLEEGVSDAGILSETYPIGEKLLFDEIEERIAKVDWESKKQKAIDRYWNNFSFIDLPTQQESEVYYIDPSIVMTKDIPAYNGKLLAYAGQRVNPLELLPLNLNMIFFDATNEDQLKWALGQFYKSGSTATMVATKLDRTDGWKQLEEITNKIGVQLYVLRQEVAQRFALRNTPSKVTTEGVLLKVEIIGQSEWEKGHD